MNQSEMNTLEILRQDIANEIRATIEEDCAECLEDKMEAIQLLSDFESATDMRECSFCSVPGSQGRTLDECTGADMGRCEPCKGIGYVTIGSSLRPELDNAYRNAVTLQ